MKPTFGSVCSGIGGAELAFDGLAESVFASEIEAFPRKVLAHRFPLTTLYGDFTALIKDPPDVDILVGGPPCVAFSAAGLRGSLGDKRGNLTLEYVRLFNALDDKRRAAGKPPAVLLFENVPGILSVSDNAFGCFLAGLVGADRPINPAGRRGKWGRAGLVIGPRRQAAWRVINGEYFGVPQRRNRVFVVASARGGFDPVEVLFEREGVQRSASPRREKGEEVTGTLSARSSAGGGLGTDFDRSGGLAPEFAALRGIADYGAGLPCLRAKGGDVGGSEVLVYGGGDTSGPRDTAPALTGHPGGRYDFDAEAFCVDSVIPFDTQQITSKTNRTKAEPGLPASTLAASGTQHVAYRLHAYGSTAMTGRGNAMAVDEVDVARALDTCGGFSAGQGRDIITDAPIAFGWQNSHHQGDSVSTDTTPSLDKSKIPAVQVAQVVRRLLPIECERLQGFKDGHTDIPGAKDGSRYKALGNAFCVPVVRWIAERLIAEIAHSEGAAKP